MPHWLFLKIPIQVTDKRVSFIFLFLSKRSSRWCGVGGWRAAFPGVVYSFTFCRHLNIGPMYLWQAHPLGGKLRGAGGALGASWAPSSSPRCPPALSPGVSPVPGWLVPVVPLMAPLGPSSLPGAALLPVFPPSLSWSHWAWKPLDLWLRGTHWAASQRVQPSARSPGAKGVMVPCAGPSQTLCVQPQPSVPQH